MKNLKNSQFHMEIPQYVQQVLDTLNSAGHEAYIVGGCVRDALLEKVPNDWDVCTSALPEETVRIFRDERTVPTGLQHGTITVLTEGGPVEITTYRVDGEYLDGRHPETVAFTRSLKEDLARRDFTMNAMAYHPNIGIVDFFGGREDLKHGCIRCVGEPETRFQEDALRILRGLRFAATLNFAIEPKTAEAMRLRKDRLQDISRERINVEVSKLLLGERAEEILTSHIDILKAATPGIEIPRPGLNQLPEDLPIRLAEVFPQNTAKHLRELRYDNDTIRLARVLSRLRGTPAPTEPKREMVRFLRKHGEVISVLHYARAGVEEVVRLLCLLKEKPCYKISDLAINGNDLIEAGLNPGPQMGEILKKLLDLVIEEEVKNERNALLKAAVEEAKHE